MSSIATTASPTTTDAPRLAAGVELLGEFEDSGFEEPPYLARRADGQVVQLTRLLHLVAEAADGTRDRAAVADAVSEAFGRRVSEDNVRFLVDERLRPLGVLAAADGSTPELPKADPLLALRHRTALVPSGAVQRIARVFAWLYAPPVLLTILIALGAFDAWLLFAHGVAGGLRQALYDPVLLLGLFGATIAATAFHEIGHATACRYGGARPGVLGAGVYLVWPAFYCDVTDAYRLDRRGRLRTDLGGVYFNAIFSLAAAAAFLATGFEPLVLVVLAQHLIVAQQMMPLLRFDGYYVLSDLTGVPDILGRVRPILRSLVPGREPDERVTALKPWVRRVVTVYIALLVPVLIFMLGSTVTAAPRMFATAYDSLGLQVDRVHAAADEGAAARVALGVVQMLALVLPCAAVVVSAGRFGRRAGSGLAGWARGSAARSALAVAGIALAVGFAAWMWWPNGDYEPIRPGERGTVGELAAGVTAIPTGRPAFTEERARRYAATPTVRRREAATRRRDAGRQPAEDDAPPAAADERQPATAQPSQPGAEAPATTTPTTAATTPTTPATAPAPAAPAAQATTPATAAPATPQTTPTTPATTPAQTTTAP